MVAVRTLSGLTVFALCLAGCGGAGGGPSATATPQFVAPSPTVPAPSSPAPPAPASVAPPSASAAASSAKPSASATTRRTIRYAFPVKAGNVAFHRTHGKYPATDIFADCGEPVVATTSGVILEVSLTDRYVEGSPDGPNNGGLSVSLLGDDGVRYYGSHLTRVQAGVRAGVRVETGQRLGTVGRTGNANNVCHLHYGISPKCAGTGDWRVRRGVIWPADYLTSWRKKGNKSPVATVRAWARQHDCKA
ncbi:M23 family metallopeptidase [Jidongwangia harbinensis]|uniref:M23 family metallopeptidase n=1 Tax=Jidongwangia harbinensis TaxID=2878561 RepID=UPI001CDA4B35|nr:M23 family metallopeptidase [Jidongwangia harbinensis]MCA2215778.1 M23 family metallopeptidase [Jidongwangia harbinensis]